MHFAISTAWGPTHALWRLERGLRAGGAVSLFAIAVSAAAADLNECVAFAVGPDGSGTLTNHCGGKLNITYCVDNSASARSCTRRPLAVATLTREAFERIPSYASDGAGAVHWAACTYPEAAVDWIPGPGGAFSCRKTCVMC